MNLFGWLIIIVVFLLVVWVISWLFNQSTTLNDYAVATSPTVIPGKTLPAPTVNFAYSIWIYVDDWTYRYNQDKVIFQRGSDGSPSLQVMFGKIDNNLTAKMKLSDGTYTNCDVSDVPIQKWTNLIVSNNDRALDIYMNGKLVNTCVSTKVPAQPSEHDDVTLCPSGFSGFTARFKYWQTGINPQEAWNIYKDGPGGNFLTSLFNSYKIQLSLIKGNETKASISI
jgi:Concanavalin A-like lectin/glucanases superfamily